MMKATIPTRAVTGSRTSTVTRKKILPMRNPLFPKVTRKRRTKAMMIH
jgi:hypothetical protein